MPEVYKEFLENIAILEKSYGDMQDIEFTVQENKLYMLQTRGGKRVGPAAIKVLTIHKHIQTPPLLCTQIYSYIMYRTCACRLP